MAYNRQAPLISENLRSIAAAAVANVKAERASVRSKDEAAFQRAVADGLSYDEQVAFRQRQLEAEKASPIRDDEYVAKLEGSVSSTKKLARFAKYRANYSDILADNVSGRVNEKSVLENLKRMRVGVTDPDLLAEIDGDIVTAEKKVKEYEDAILSNQVKKAKYDGTMAELKFAESKVAAARLLAEQNGNDDEVAEHDATLSALRSQQSGVRVNNAITDYVAKSATTGYTASGKLAFINSQIGAYDNFLPVKIGDRNYDTARQFWEEQRNGYLNGTSETFGSFMSEVKTELDGIVNADSAKFGYPTKATLDRVKASFDDFRSRAEFAAFAPKLDSLYADVMGRAVSKYAERVTNVGTNNLGFKDADKLLKEVSTNYGIDTTDWRLQLDQNLRSIPDAVIPASEKEEIAPPTEDIVLPKVGAPEPVPEPVKPAEPAPTAVPKTGSIVDFLAGQKKPSDFASRKKLAEDSGIQDYVGSAEQNAELLRVLSKPPEAPAAPVETPAQPQPKQMATLVNPNLPEGDPNRRKAVEVGSAEAQDLFSKQYVLETK